MSRIAKDPVIIPDSVIALMELDVLTIKHLKIIGIVVIKIVFDYILVIMVHIITEVE